MDLENQPLLPDRPRMDIARHRSAFDKAEALVIVTPTTILLL